MRKLPKEWDQSRKLARKLVFRHVNPDTKEEHPGMFMQCRKCFPSKERPKTLQERCKTDETRLAELLDERDRPRALLVKSEEAIAPTREGKRDGGTFGRLSQVSDDIRAALSETKA